MTKDEARKRMEKAKLWWEDAIKALDLVEAGKVYCISLKPEGGASWFLVKITQSAFGKQAINARLLATNDKNWARAGTKKTNFSWYWASLIRNSIVKEVPAEEYPLYLGHHVSKAFEKLLRIVP